MAWIFLGIGSNYNRVENILSGLRELSSLFGPLKLSPVYESESIGFIGDSFLNMVVAFETDCRLQDVSQQLKDLEDQHGRSRCMKLDSPRSLDIDILLYGDCVGSFDGIELPRGEILKNAFVLRPLAELAPEWVHPVAMETYLSLWKKYNAQQQLWPFALEIDGEPLPEDVLLVPAG